MERLTKRYGKGLVGVGNPLKYYSYSDIKGVLERLADIEDVLGDTYNLENLRRLVESDREGRNFIAPVNVGDKVYCFQGHFNNSTLKSEIKIRCRTVDYVQSLPDLFECNGIIYKFRDVGKTVFLTREAAEAALAKEENHD